MGVTDAPSPLLDEGIKEVLADSGYYGMCTFDQSLLDLVTSGRVSLEEATEAATSPHDFQLMLAQTGANVG